MSNLKLYVWHGVLIDYTSGVMFALATNAREARKIILENNDTKTVRDDLKEKPKVYKKPVGFAVWGGG